MVIFRQPGHNDIPYLQKVANCSFLVMLHVCSSPAVVFFRFQVRSYDRVQELAFEALHYLAVLAGLRQVQRHDSRSVR